MQNKGFPHEIELELKMGEKSSIYFSIILKTLKCWTAYPELSACFLYFFILLFANKMYLSFRLAETNEYQIVFLFRYKEGTNSGNACVLSGNCMYCISILPHVMVYRAKRSLVCLSFQPFTACHCGYSQLGYTWRETVHRNVS